MQANYPAVERIVLVPVVGAPPEACVEVRAAGNQLAIYQAIQKAVSDPGRDVAAGPAPTVASCAHFSDAQGHLTAAGAMHVHGQLKTHFRR
ncbi:MAG: hypothetical protein KGY81_10640 [Phycisphaerae bacterium]|nr:hypothetical protein [Phycisphaerae bacterium]